MSTPLVYRRYGGSLQVHLPTFDALVEAIRIPETQWIATACPLTGLRVDPRFLALVDSDNNGRIRVAELREAVEYTARMLRYRKGADSGSEVLELEALSDQAAHLREAARLLLEALKSEDRTRISLAQVRASEESLRAAGRNGDGIVAPSFFAESLRATATRLMACFPEEKNRAGQPGLSVPMIQRFREERAALQGHLSTRESTFAWGEQSLPHARRVREVAPLMEAYFAQCRLVAAQPEAAAALKLKPESVESSFSSAEALARAMASLPIAPADPSGSLAWSRLYRGPAYELLQSFREQVATPLIGKGEALTDGDWRSLHSRAEAILGWQSKLEASPLFPLLEQLPTLPEAELEAISAACQADKALEGQIQAVAELEKLVLYQRWLLAFANNFLSMPDLYQPDRRALYEQGTLILGGRKYTLAVKVPDRGAHTALTGAGPTCILYVQVSPREGGESYEVAVPVTRGRSRELAAGKRGIFQDVEGRELDAVVTHVVSQPVSIWEAMTQPFVRVGTFLSSKFESLAGSSDKAMDESIAKAHERAATAPEAPAPAPAAQGSNTAGLVAAGGVAFAAVGSSLAFILTQLKSLTLLELLTAGLLLVSAVMIPAGLLGWWRLRQRNLALLLEGSGWALNDRLLLTRDLAALLTRKPRLPHHATVDRVDQARAWRRSLLSSDEQERSSVWVRVGLILLVLAVVAWQVHGPLLRSACAARWISKSTCQVLLPAEAPAAPAQP